MAQQGKGGEVETDDDGRPGGQGGGGDEEVITQSKFSRNINLFLQTQTPDHNP